MNFKEKLSNILGAGMEPELKELKIQEILDAIDTTTIPVTHPGVKADSLRLAEILTLYGEDKIGLHAAIVEIEAYHDQHIPSEDRLYRMIYENSPLGERAANNLATAIHAEMKGEQK